jgi:hypothetical protein
MQLLYRGKLDAWIMENECKSLAPVIQTEHQTVLTKTPPAYTR